MGTQTTAGWTQKQPLNRNKRHSQIENEKHCRIDEKRINPAGGCDEGEGTYFLELLSCEVKDRMQEGATQRRTVMHQSEDPQTTIKLRQPLGEDTRREWFEFLISIR